MGELTNALQGKLNSREGHVKDPARNQLDLFSSLADRAPSAPKFVAPPPVSPGARRPEPEMVLPPSSRTPPDVSADVRAVLSDSGPARPVEPSSAAGHLPLRTGVYHRPLRPAAPPVSPPAAPPPPPPPGERFSPWKWIRDWFAGVEMDRRMISLVVVLAVLVALVAFWSACPRQGRVKPETAERAGDIQAEPTPQAMALAGGGAPAGPEASSAPPSEPLPAADWAIPGTVATQNGNATLIRFVEPAFESLDNISIKGMAGIKAIAAKLATMKAGTRVVVTGYTDDVPLSKPTERFQSNADIAAARAQTALEHLAQYAGAGKALAFEARTGDPAQAPYPNDSPKNRRLNRTVTVEVLPAP
ncbi:MAG: hypothetical protein AB7V22_11435 [Kiritimatiellia bacterium]